MHAITAHLTRNLKATVELATLLCVSEIKQYGIVSLLVKFS